MINRRNFLGSILPASLLPFVSSPTPGATASLAALFPDAPLPKFEIGDRICISWTCDDERDTEKFGKRFTEHGVILGGVFNDGLIEFSGAEVYKESDIWNYLVLVDGTDGDNPYVIFEKESDLVAVAPKQKQPKSEPVAAFDTATPAPKFKMGDYLEYQLITDDAEFY